MQCMQFHDFLVNLQLKFMVLLLNIFNLMQYITFAAEEVKVILTNFINYLRPNLSLKFIVRL